jgi:hypothetical protein
MGRMSVSRQIAEALLQAGSPVCAWTLHAAALFAAACQQKQQQQQQQQQQQLVVDYWDSHAGAAAVAAAAGAAAVAAAKPTKSSSSSFLQQFIAAAGSVDAPTVAHETFQDFTALMLIDKLIFTHPCATSAAAMRLLLAQRANPNAPLEPDQTRCGSTPLCMAVREACRLYGPASHGGEQAFSSHLEAVQYQCC